MKPHGLTWIAALLLGLAGCLHPSLAEDSSSPAPPESSPPKPEPPEKQIQRLVDEAKAAIAEIKDIEAKITPIQHQLAQSLFNLSPEEFDVLRMQAENPDFAKDYFNKLNHSLSQSLDGIAQFFDLAYQSMIQGNLDVGAEERLVQADAELFKLIEKGIIEAIQSRPDGKELLAMLQRRQALKARIDQIIPLLRYLRVRRNWQSLYPGFIENLRAADEERLPK